jgi:ABC-2 type transport system permease protein
VRSMRGTGAAAAVARRELWDRLSAPPGCALLAAFLLLSSWQFFRALFPAGQASLAPLFSATPWVFLLFVPAVAMRSWAGPRELGADEIALPARSREVVLGRFLAGVAFLVLATGLTLPLLLVVSALGDPDPGPVIGGYVGLVLLGAAYLAISQFASTLIENRIVAFVAGATVSFALFIVGLGRSFARMAAGVLDSRDLVCCVSVTGLFLYLTLTTAEARGGGERPAPSAPGRAKARAAAKAAAAVALFIVVSAVSAGVFTRADLTAAKEFTISRSSKDLLTALPDVVTVTVYLSEDLPRRLAGIRSRIEDVVDQYRSYGGERFRASFVDPSRDAEAEASARSAGIRPVPLQAIEGDRAVAREVYLGMTVRCADREETVPSVADATRLEYELTSAVLKVTMERRRVVGFLTGHGERSIEGEYSLAAEALRRTYDVREVSAGDLAPDGGITTLVAAGSGHTPDAELYEIDQFLMRGGRAVFLLDGAKVRSAGDLRSEPGQGNIYDFVGYYGAVVRSDLVVDMVNSPAPFLAEERQITVPYPYWPKAFGPNIAREHPVVSGFDAIPFPWTSSIAVKDALPAGASVTVLARSSDRSWSVPAFADLRPLAKIADPPDAAAGPGGHLPLAVAISGRLTSAFVGKPVIVERNGHAQFTEPVGRITTGAPTQIVVVGNARMFENTLLGQFDSNLALFRNIVDWLTLGDTLAGIRTQGALDRPLRAVGDTRRLTVTALGIFAAPAGVVAFGLAGAVAARRRRAPATRASER